MVDFKRVLRSAEKGVMNLLDILKEDPIYGGRLRNLKSKEMGFERRKFHLILEIGGKHTGYICNIKSRPRTFGNL